MAVQDVENSYYSQYANRTYLTISTNVAAAVATATIPAVAGRTFYVLGILINGLGATVGLGVAPTITGLLGGTITLAYAAAVGVLVQNTNLNVSFGDVGIPASAVNQSVVLSCPSLGTGNTSNTVVIWGYYL